MAANQMCTCKHLPNGLKYRYWIVAPGIVAEQRERVFAPFYRLEGSRNKHTGGVGLGLSAGRAIVLEHGGSLLLADREGGGLVATVILPKGGGLCSSWPGRTWPGKTMF